MDIFTQNQIWQSIKEKLDKGEKLTLSHIFWGILSNGIDKPSRKKLNGQDRVDVLSEKFEAFKESLKRMNYTDDKLKEIYNEEKEKQNKSLKESEAFFKIFQDQCKEIKAEVNGKKISKDLKDSTINLLRNYLEMLNREIVELKVFPDFETWKKDTVNVAENQVVYLKEQIQKAKKIRDKNEKELENIIKEIPFPEGFELTP